MINSLALRVASRLKEANPNHPATIAVLQFAIEGLINLVGTLLLAMIGAVLLGQTEDVIVALVSFAALRMVTGGYHLNSSIACMLATASAVNIIPFLELSDPARVTLTIISLLLAFRFAPSNIENSSRIPSRYYPGLKVGSLLVIGVNLWVQADIVAVCFFLQCLTLFQIRR